MHHLWTELKPTKKNHPTGWFLVLAPPEENACIFFIGHWTERHASDARFQSRKRPCPYSSLRSERGLWHKIQKRKVKNKSTAIAVLLFLAPPVGLEPTTPWLTVRCSRGRGASHRQIRRLNVIKNEKKRFQRSTSQERKEKVAFLNDLRP